MARANNRKAVVPRVRKFNPADVFISYNDIDVSIDEENAEKFQHYDEFESNVLGYTNNGSNENCCGIVEIGEFYQSDAAVHLRQTELDEFATKLIEHFERNNYTAIACTFAKPKYATEFDCDIIMKTLARAGFQNTEEYVSRSTGSTIRRYVYII